MLSKALPFRSATFAAVLAMAVCFAVAILLLRGVAAVLPLQATRAGQVFLDLWFLLPCLGWPVVWAFFVRRRLAQGVRRELNSQKGLRLCLSCGYDLSAAPEARCPECGQPFDESLLNKSGGLPETGGERRSSGE